MSVRNFRVNITPIEAKFVIKKWVLRSSVSATLADQYVRKVGDCAVIIFILEQNFMRVSNRVSLTITIDNFDGVTKVHAVSTGYCEGLDGMDLDVGMSFSGSVEEALRPYIVKKE